MALTNAERQKRYRDRQRQTVPMLLRPRDGGERYCKPVELSLSSPLEQAIHEADDAVFMIGVARSEADRKRWIKRARTKLALARKFVPKPYQS